MKNLLTLIVLITSPSVGIAQGSTKHYYNIDGELLVSKRIIDGKEQEGYIFKGEHVNLTDGLGRKTGKWLTLRSSKQAGKFEGIYNILNYKEGVKVDTGHFYNRSDQLTEIFIYGNDSTLPKRIVYNNSGGVSRIDYHTTDPKYRFVRSESIHYSDTLSTCITKRETYVNQKVNYVYDYKNCQLYSKTSVKEDFTTVESEVTETFYPPGLNQKPIEYTETVLMPFLKPIPYSVEIGDFDDKETYLLNGTISYYAASGLLLESKEVVDGVIVE